MKFPCIDSLLTCRFRKDQAFDFEQLDRTEFEAYKTLKSSMISLKVLEYLRENGRSMIVISAFDKEIGFVSLQEPLKVPESRSFLVKIRNKAAMEYQAMKMMVVQSYGPSCY